MMAALAFEATIPSVASHPVTSPHVDPERCILPAILLRRDAISDVFEEARSADLNRPAYEQAKSHIRDRCGRVS